MAAVVIRNLDERVKERLRLRAARHGRSMESEAREILTDAVSEPDDDMGLLQAVIQSFGDLGGVELEIPDRASRPRPVELD